MNVARDSAKVGGQLRLLLVGLLVSLVCGCEIAKLRQQENDDTQRVRLKEGVVQAEQGRAAELSRQKEQLTAELSERQLSLGELNDRVEQMLAANARESNANEQVRLERKRLIGKIQEYSSQLAALRQSTEDTSPRKQEQVEYLKHQIRDQLDLLLH